MVKGAHIARAWAGPRHGHAPVGESRSTARQASSQRDPQPGPHPFPSKAIGEPSIYHIYIYIAFSRGADLPHQCGLAIVHGSSYRIAFPPSRLPPRTSTPARGVRVRFSDLQSQVRVGNCADSMKGSQLLRQKAQSWPKPPLACPCATIGGRQSCPRNGTPRSNVPASPVQPDTPRAERGFRGYWVEFIPTAPDLSAPAPYRAARSCCGGTLSSLRSWMTNEC
jgi:hypothetical protein